MKLYLYLTATLLLQISISFAQSKNAPAQKATPSNNVLLIQKMKKIYAGLPESDSSRAGVALRLADLLSEEARRIEYQAYESNCSTCPQGQKERKEAISLYREALGQVPEYQKVRVYLQLAYLYQRQDQWPEAERLMQSVVANPSLEPELKREAEILLGEGAFKKEDFTSTITHLRNAEKISPLSGEHQHRLGWALFKTDRVDEARSVYLATLKKGDVDPALRQEIIRDLRALYIYSSFNDRDIESYRQSLASNEQLGALILLSKELRDLGRTSDVITVMKRLEKMTLNSQERSYVLMAKVQVQNSQGRSQDALKVLKNVFVLGPFPESCQDATCYVSQKDIQSLVLNMNKTLTEADSVQLVESYAEAFPQDSKTMVALFDEKATATNPNKVGVIELGNLVHDVAKLDSTLKEKLLLRVIEVAEQSKDFALKDQAYAKYLQNVNAGTKRGEVLYQQAFNLYQHDAKSDQSFSRLQAVAKDSQVPTKLRQQAANLVLDVLAERKDDSGLRETSAQYAAMFPDERDSFLGIKTRADINSAARIIQSEGANLSDAEKILSSIDLSRLSPLERLTTMKNQMALYTRRQDWVKAGSPAEWILGSSISDKADKEAATAVLLNREEARLDFARAYQYAKDLQTHRPGDFNLAIKVALLAELSGQNPVAHLHHAEQLAHKSDRKSVTEQDLVGVQARLISLGVQPKTAVDYKQHGEMLSWVLMQGETKNPKAGFGQIIDKQLAATQVAKIRRLANEFSVQPVAISPKGSLDRRVQQTLAALKSEEKNLKQAVDQKDSERQGLILERLYSLKSQMISLLENSAPPDLDAEQKAEYAQLLDAELAPHRNERDSFAAKLAEFRQNASTNASQIIQALKGVGKDGVHAFVQAAKQSRAPSSAEADSGIRSAVVSAGQNWLEGEQKTVSVAAMQARQNAKNNPNDPAALSAWQDAEEKAGNAATAAYLKARLGSQMEAR